MEEPTIGEKFAVHFDYMDENEFREEEVKSVAWSDSEKEWYVSNTENQLSVNQMEQEADTYTAISLSVQAYNLG